MLLVFNMLGLLKSKALIPLYFPNCIQLQQINHSHNILC